MMTMMIPRSRSTASILTLGARTEAVTGESNVCRATVAAMVDSVKGTGRIVYKKILGDSPPSPPALDLRPYRLPFPAPESNEARSSRSPGITPVHACRQCADSADRLGCLCPRIADGPRRLSAGEHH